MRCTAEISIHQRVGDLPQSGVQQRANQDQHQRLGMIPRRDGDSTDARARQDATTRGATSPTTTGQSDRTHRAQLADLGEHRVHR